MLAHSAEALLAPSECCIAVHLGETLPALTGRAEQLSKEGRRANTPPMKIVGDAITALDEITPLARSSNSLALPHSISAERDRA